MYAKCAHRKSHENHENANQTRREAIIEGFPLGVQLGKKRSTNRNKETAHKINRVITNFRRRSIENSLEYHPLRSQFLVD